jgi:hypothetical protein
MLAILDTDKKQISIKVSTRYRCPAMKTYRVLVLGEHCLMDVSGSRRYMGFYVTRFVRGTSGDQARTAAIAAVRADPKIDGLVLNDGSDPPRFHVEELAEVSDSAVPAESPGFALFDDEPQSAGAGIGVLPYLVIRRGASFWVEHRALRECTATARALKEGCFRDACLYDIKGDLWHVVDAQFTHRLSWGDSLLPWRQLPVLIELRPLQKPAMAEVLAELAAILQSANAFVENLDTNAGEVLECLTRATTPVELIAYAESRA